MYAAMGKRMRAEKFNSNNFVLDAKDGTIYHDLGNKANKVLPILRQHYKNLKYSGKKKVMSYTT